MSRGKLHAGMSVQDIMGALARVNWGPLQGRAWAYRRMLLETLTLMMREQRADYAAEIITTAPQVATRMGCCEKTVRNCLHDLEDLGLVEYQRGGIWDGKPQPSVIKIIKKKIVSWVMAWRPKNDERLRRLRLETLARIAGLTKARIRPRQRAQVHAEPDSSLSISDKRAHKEGARSPYVTPTPARAARAKREYREDAIKAWKATATLREEAKKDKPMSQMTLDLHKMQTLPPEEFMPLVCGHGATLPRFCNRCRYEGWTKKQEAERIASKEAARKRAEQRTREEASEEAKGSAFAEYMKATYPSARRSEWHELIKIDPRAWELSND